MYGTLSSLAIVFVFFPETVLGQRWRKSSKAKDKKPSGVPSQVELCLAMLLLLV